MGATVTVNKRTVVHGTSEGVVSTFPDVCKTPSPGGPVAVPYPNVACSNDTSEGSRDVQMDGESIMLRGAYFATSTGDEAGTVGGVVSGTFCGKAEFINYSFDVAVEGRNVPRQGDSMLQNKRQTANTSPTPEIQPPLPVVGVDFEDEPEGPWQLVALEQLDEATDD